MDPTRVAVRVTSSAGEVSTGGLESSTERSLGVRFWDSMPELPMGDRVTLTLSGAELRDTLNAQATVRGRRDAGEASGRWYGFRIEPTRDTRDAIARLIAGALNRRRSFRAAPPANADLRATIEAMVDERKRRRVTASISDLSATGCALDLSLEADRALAGSVYVIVQLPMGETEDPVLIAAAIRHRTFTARGARYGVAFEPGRTEGYRGQQERIVRQVMRWQRRTLTDVHRRIDFV
jgi:hypothetical protein